MAIESPEVLYNGHPDKERHPNSHSELIQSPHVLAPIVEPLDIVGEPECCNWLSAIVVFALFLVTSTIPRLLFTFLFFASIVLWGCTWWLLPEACSVAYTLVSRQARKIIIYHFHNSQWNTTLSLTNTQKKRSSQSGSSCGYWTSK